MTRTFGSLPVLRLAVVASSLVCVAEAQAAALTWNLVANGNAGGMCAQQSANQNTFDNRYVCNNGTGSVEVSAWSTDRGGFAGNAQAGSSPVYTAGNGANRTFANALLSDEGTRGFGNSNRTEGLAPSQPSDGFDSIPNDPNRFELMLLDFGSTEVVLDTIGIGWKNGTGSGDMTVMRWIGTKPGFGTAAASVGGTDTLAAQRCSTGGLVTDCWSLVQSFADVPTDGSLPYGEVNAQTHATSAMASSWWLIGSFNTALNDGTTTCRNAANTANAVCTEGNDAFDINFIGASGDFSSGTPLSAPGAMALLGLAWGATVFRRLRPAGPSRSA